MIAISQGRRKKEHVWVHGDYEHHASLSFICVARSTSCKASIRSGGKRSRLIGSVRIQTVRGERTKKGRRARVCTCIAWETAERSAQ